MYYHGLLYPPDCHECPLMNTTKVLPDGPVPASLAFCAEEPGNVELKQGLGLVGPSGQLLWQLCEQAGISRDDVWVTNAALCLGASTRVTESSGRVRLLSEIVEDKIKGPFLSVGPDGLLHEDEACEWFENELGDRTFYTLSPVNSPKDFSPLSLTGDHELLTRDGYKRVDCLEENDEVALGMLQPSDVGKSFLMGALLGPAWIRKYRAELFFHLHISERSEAYKKILIYLTHCVGVKSSSPDQVKASVDYAHYFKKLIREIYTDSKCLEKRFVPDLFTLDDPMLASWFMVSGYAETRGARLELHGFRESELRVVQERLYAKGLWGDMFKTMHSSYIKLNEASARLLYAKIASYVPKTLWHMLPEAYRGQFNPSHFKGAFYGQPSFGKVRRNLFRFASGPHTKVYCMRMKTYDNFLTASFVAHNCAAKEIKLPSGAVIPQTVVKALAAKACRRRLLGELIQVNPRVIVPMGNWALWALSDIPNAKIFAYRGSISSVSLPELAERVDRGLTRAPIKQMKEE